VYIAEVLSGVCLARQLRGLWQTKTYYAYATEGHARQTNKKKKVAAKQGQGGRGGGGRFPPDTRIYGRKKYIKREIPKELFQESHEIKFLEFTQGM